MPVDQICRPIKPEKCTGSQFMHLVVVVKFLTDTRVVLCVQLGADKLLFFHAGEMDYLDLPHWLPLSDAQMMLLDKLSVGDPLHDKCQNKNPEQGSCCEFRKVTTNPAQPQRTKQAGWCCRCLPQFQCMHGFQGRWGVTWSGTSRTTCWSVRNRTGEGVSFCHFRMLPTLFTDIQVTCHTLVAPFHTRFKCSTMLNNIQSSTAPDF